MRTPLMATMLALAATAAAAHQDQDHQPLHGGVVAEAGELEFELVARADAVTLHVRDHARKPLPTQGGGGKLTALAGSRKAQAELRPAGPGRFEAHGDFPVTAGAKYVASVTLPSRKPANVRFVLENPR